jgi:hypothetical protein
VKAEKYYGGASAEYHTELIIATEAKAIHNLDKEIQRRLSYE